MLFVYRCNRLSKKVWSFHLRVNVAIHKASRVNMKVMKQPTVFRSSLKDLFIRPAHTVSVKTHLPQYVIIAINCEEEINVRESGDLFLWSKKQSKWSWEKGRRPYPLCPPNYIQHNLYKMYTVSLNCELNFSFLFRLSVSGITRSYAAEHETDKVDRVGGLY